MKNYVSSLFKVHTNEEGMLEGESISLQAKARSTIDAANSFAKKQKLTLSDEGRAEYSLRFPGIVSFGVTNCRHRLFVLSN